MENRSKHQTIGRQGAMAALLAAGAISAGLALASPPAGDELLRRGRAVAAQCAACHGADGNSTNPLSPNLAGQFPGYLKLQLMNFRSGERPSPVMKGIALTLTDPQIDDVSKYFGSMHAKPQRPGDRALAARGQVIFSKGGADGAPACASCHGQAGQGQALYPRIASQPATYTMEQLTVYRTTPSFNNPLANVMKTVAVKLTDQEAQAVSAYLATMP